MNEIVVISGKGGTGKTSIVSGLAATGPAKILADCDVDAADLHLILAPDQAEHTPFYSGERAVVTEDECTSCGLCQEKCRFGAITLNGTAHIADEHCEGCGLCDFVCPVGAVKMEPRLCGDWYVSNTRHGEMVHARLGIGQENSGKLVTTVRRRSAEIAEDKNIDVVLTDGPPGIGCPVIASLTNANVALVVTEPTLSAIHDLKRVRGLTRHFGIRTMAVINKSGINPGLANSAKSWCAENDVPVIGTFDYDQDFTLAQIAGQSVTEYAPEKFRPVFESMWKELLAWNEGR